MNDTDSLDLNDSLQIELHYNFCVCVCAPVCLCVCRSLEDCLSVENSSSGMSSVRQELERVTARLQSSQACQSHLKAELARLRER